MNSVHLTIDLPASPDRVLDLVEHPERLVPYVPELISVRSLSDHPSARNYEWRFEVDALPIRLVQHRVRDNESQCIRTHRIDGDLAQIDGAWTVRQHPHGSRLGLDIQYRIGLPIEFYIAGLFHQKMTTFARSLLDGLRRAVEAAP